MSVNESNWHIEMAKVFKERDNTEYIGCITGKVVGVNPIVISCFDGQSLFKENKLYICSRLKEYTEKVTVNIDGYTYEGQVKHEGLKQNDRVMLIAVEDNQTFFVIDKVE